MTDSHCLTSQKALALTETEETAIGVLIANIKAAMKPLSALERGHRFSFYKGSNNSHYVITKKGYKWVHYERCPTPQDPAVVPGKALLTKMVHPPCDLFDCVTGVQTHYGEF